MAGTFPESWEETCFVTIQQKGGTAKQFAAITETVDISEPDYPGESIPTCAGGRIWKQSSQEDGEITLEIYPIELDEADSTGLFLYNGGLATQTATITACDGDATTITITTQANHNLTVGDFIRIGGTNETYKGDYTVATQNGTTGLTIADTAHNISAENDGTIWSYDTVEPLITETSAIAGVQNWGARGREKFIVALMWTTDTSQTSAMSATTATDKVALRFYAKDCRIVSHKSAFTDGILKTTVTFKFPAINKASTTRPFAWESTEDTDTNPLPALTYT